MIRPMIRILMAKPIRPANSPKIHGRIPKTSRSAKSPSTANRPIVKTVRSMGMVSREKNERFRLREAYAGRAKSVSDNGLPGHQVDGLAGRRVAGCQATGQPDNPATRQPDNLSHNRLTHLNRLYVGSIPGLSA